MAKKKYVMLVDTARCVFCEACVTSCRAEWGTSLGVSRNWVRETMTMTNDGMPRLSFLSGRCMHCDEPPCVPACPTGASFKGDDGLVLVDRDLCTGCEFCVDVCPYDARFRDPADGMISKCTFCAPRIADGEEPASFPRSGRRHDLKVHLLCAPDRRWRGTGLRQRLFHPGVDVR